MLINLNEEIFGYVPVELLPHGVEDDTRGKIEYYLGMRPDDSKRYILMASRDASAVADEMALLDSMSQKRWYAAWHQAYYDNEIKIAAIELPEKASTLGAMLESGPMSWDVALPLFYEILISRLDTTDAERFCHTSLAPDNIMLVADGSDVYPFAPYIPAWDKNASNQEHLSTAPELLADNASAVPDETAWLYSAAVMLTMMLQREYPYRLEKNPALASHDEFIRDYLRATDSPPHIDAIGSLRRLLEANVSAQKESRSASVNEFLNAIYDIIKEKGMNVPERWIDSHKASSAGNDNDLQAQSYDHIFKTGDEDSHDTAGHSDSRLKIDFMRGGGNGFTDVAGLDDIKAKMTRNFIAIVKNPDLARTFRIEPPNGLLLWGPPGNGKSFISKKLAEESGLLYATVNPGDLGSIFIHGTQGLIADMFTKCERMAAKEKSGVLLVIEEFDSLVPSRSSSTGDSNSRNDEVAEFLTRLNNCASKGVYVIATTNRIDAIDPAIMRKGRMDEVIYVDMPDEQVRLKLFQLELNDRPHDELDFNKLVKMTDGFSSGDISYLVKESARKAFELTLASPEKSVVTITQENLENTIGNAHPSVTAAERHKYEKLRDSYDKNRRENPRIGF